MHIMSHHFNINRLLRMKMISMHLFGDFVDEDKSALNHDRSPVTARRVYSNDLLNAGINFLYFTKNDLYQRLFVLFVRKRNRKMHFAPSM